MLTKLLKIVRRKAVSDCQKVLSQYSGYDTSFILAKMSDLKLFVPDAETQREIENYKKELENATENRYARPRSS